MSRDATGLALSVLNSFAGSSIADQLKIRKWVEKLAYTGTKTGFQAIGVASRQFKAVNNVLKPARLDKPTRNNDLFDLSITDEQQMIRDSVQRFAIDLIRPAAAQANDDCMTPQNLLDQATELGLHYYAVPEAFGGAALERSPVTSMLIAEDLAYGDMGIALSILAPISVANALTQWGTADQQSRYLGAFVEDKPVKASIAVNEPAPLFNPHKLSTKAEKRGNQYILNGIKSLVPIAAGTELFLVAAEVAGEGPAVFLIESGTEGLSIKEDNSMGNRAAGLCTLRLKNLTLNEQQRLGSPGEFNYAEFVNLAHLSWCAMAVGVCQAVLDYVIPYSNERIAFGEPVSHRQSVAFMIANIRIELDAMRVMTMRAASLAEQGRPFQREAYLAKVLCTEKALEIATNGVQLLGGHGFTKEHPVERWYRDLQIVAMADGGLHL
ncbi:acyl-CoA dehydrogenase, C-terminal domain protein [Oleiphilus messinensis]|uniref:Acyl-CoA dehydrogenase, C-terminal domain protein n=1 Tax=Oleiphilus messinensis TaxID=141451 RepID=A0A1Y0IGZ2_9GAMM|nr:acyl-CoA dehydrogenase family protein [Oleiphilus messinensis]ARU59106.1 acyl-CoA dehydrogenase, C-terminal domain protein [Oleiphilus messinensis]